MNNFSTEEARQPKLMKCYDSKMFPEEAFKLLPRNVAPIVAKTIHDLLELLLVILRVLYLHERDCDILLIHWGAVLYVHESKHPHYVVIHLEDLIICQFDISRICIENNVMGQGLYD